MQRAMAVQSECRIVAPRAGTVTIKAKEIGEVVLPGTTIFELTHLDELTVKFYVPNARLGETRLGLPVTVKADPWPDETFAGTIDFVSSSAEFTPRTVQTRDDRERLVFAVKARLVNRDDKLRPGMPVEVTLAP